VALRVLADRRFRGQPGSDLRRQASRRLNGFNALPTQPAKGFHHALTAAAVSRHSDPDHHLDRPLRALTEHHLVPNTPGHAMTATQTATHTPTALKTAAVAKDAIALLEADHEAVSQLFDEYEKTRSVANKKSLIAQICTALSVHAQIEEEIFYPEVKAALKDKRLVPEATVEHAGVKDLLAQLEGLEPDGEVCDAKVKVLSEYVKHHVNEEQNEMFPKVKASSLDLDDLGARLTARKEQLMVQKTGDPRRQA
jgi:hemerythrin-like domain-containing protein